MGKKKEYDGVPSCTSGWLGLSSHCGDTPMIIGVGVVQTRRFALPTLIFVLYAAGNSCTHMHKGTQGFVPRPLTRFFAGELKLNLPGGYLFSKREFWLVFSGVDWKILFEKARTRECKIRGLIFIIREGEKRFWKRTRDQRDQSRRHL